MESLQPSGTEAHEYRVDPGCVTTKAIPEKKSEARSSSLRRTRTKRRQRQAQNDDGVERASADVFAAASDAAVNGNAAAACRECVDYLVEYEEGDHDDGNLDPKLQICASADTNKIRV